MLGQTIPIGWVIANNAIAFLFSFLTTLLLTYMVWRLMKGFLEAVLGRGIAILGAGFSAILVLAAGLKISIDYLTKAQRVYIIQGVIAGIVDTINACILPKQLSPLEFIILISFGVYLCYWLHTRFAPKHTTDDLKRKLDRAVETENTKRPPYPY